MKNAQHTQNTPLLFKSKHIRRIWHENEWWFSVVDVVGVLVESDRGRKYWNDLKSNIIQEGYFQLSAKIGQLKLRSEISKATL